MYRFIRAESAAMKRIKYLESLAEKRKCGTQDEIKPKVINPQMLNYPRKHNLSPNYNYYQYNGRPQYAPPAQGQQKGQQVPNQYVPASPYQGQQQYAPPQHNRQPQGQYYPNQYAPSNTYYGQQPRYAPPQKQQQSPYYQPNQPPAQYEKPYEEYNLP